MQPGGYIEEFRTPVFEQFIREVLLESSIYLDSIGKFKEGDKFRDRMQHIDLTKHDPHAFCWTSVHEGNR